MHLLVTGAMLAIFRKFAVWVIILLLLPLESQAQSINYYSHIKPIVDQKCAHCHMQDRIAFPLDTYEALYNFRDPSSNAIYARRMPPWLAAPGFQNYKNDFSMTEEEIAIWKGWEKNQFKKGDPKNAKIVNEPKVEHFQPDVEITVVDESNPFLPKTEYNDDYRCFLSRWTGKKKTYLTGVRFETNEDSPIHHGTFYIVKPEVVPIFRSMLRSTFKSNSVKNYRCFGSWMPDVIFEDIPGLMANPQRQKLLWQLQNSSHWLISWGPGFLGLNLEEDNPGESIGIPIQPGSLIISQLHIANIQDLKKPIRKASLKLKTADQVASPGIVVISSDKRWISDPKNNPLTVPAKESLSVSFNHQLKNIFRDLRLAIGENKKYSGLRLHSLGLHMHDFGVSTEAELQNSVTKKSEVLLKIPRWDYRWQFGYDFIKPYEFSLAELENNSIKLSCKYFNPNDKPVYGGYRVEDEMCQLYAFYSLIPERKAEKSR